jgi:hypothetical protein
VALDASLLAPVRGAAQKVVPVRPDLRVHQALLDAAEKNGLRLRLRHQKTAVGWAGRGAAREFDYPVLCREPVRDCQSASGAKEPADGHCEHRGRLRQAARQKAEIQAGRRVVVVARLSDVARRLGARCSASPLVRQERQAPADE